MKKYFIVFVIIGMMLSCQEKTPEEILTQKFTKGYALSLLDSVVSPYVKMDWNQNETSVSWDLQEDGMYKVKIEGVGKARHFGGERLNFYSLWEFSNLQSAPGYITFLTEGQGLIDEALSADGVVSSNLLRINPNVFQRVLSDYVEKQKKFKVDYANKEVLAYSNKSSVHFGMSEEDNKKSSMRERQVFYDGLIGEDAYDCATPEFADSKFVGFEISNQSHRTVNYENVIKHAKLLSSRSSRLTRCNMYEFTYKSNLYNLRIVKWVGHGDDRTTITVWWNSYFQFYKK